MKRTIRIKPYQRSKGTIKVKGHMRTIETKNVSPTSKAPINRKKYYVQENIGKVKYALSFHDGKKKNRDGSPFYDLRTFKNKKDLENEINKLKSQGYMER